MRITVTDGGIISKSFDGLSRAYPKINSDICDWSEAEHECAVRLSAALQISGLFPVDKLAPEMTDKFAGAGCPVKHNKSKMVLKKHVPYLQLRAKGLAELLAMHPIYLGSPRKIKGQSGNPGLSFEACYRTSRGIVYWVHAWQNGSVWREHIDLWDQGNIRAGRSKAIKYNKNATEIWFWPV